MKLFQIKEDDLATLEAQLPRLADSMMVNLTNADRAKWRQVQEILSNVRWNYGPPTDIEVIPGGGES